MTYQCSCGFSLRLTGDARTVEGILAILMPMHQGEGHTATDPRTAYRARKAQEELDQLELEDDRAYTR